MPHIHDVTGSQIVVGDGALAVSGDYVEGDKNVHHHPHGVDGTVGIRRVAPADGS
jgi:hypothetical protein